VEAEAWWIKLLNNYKEKPMNNFGNFVMNVAIDKEPFTKPWKTQNASGEHDILPGVIIPSSPNVRKDNLKEVELKISKEMMQNVKKSALEITKMIVKNEDALKSGNLYAKVTCYMAPIERGGVTNMFTPYINDIELVQPSEQDQPKVRLALQKNVKTDSSAY
jgi:hypothetical protein